MPGVVEAVRDYLVGLEAPALVPFLRDWPALATWPVAPGAELPVLRHLPAAGLGPTASLVRAAPQLAWRQSYDAAAVGSAFLANYGWAELIVPDRIACGVLLLGPQTHYPSHRHAAEEVYVPLAGTAAWSRGGADWAEAPPGAVIHHPPWLPHAMRTGVQALLALYLWRGDLRQGARLD